MSPLCRDYFNTELGRRDEKGKEEGETYLHAKCILEECVDNELEEVE